MCCASSGYPLFGFLWLLGSTHTQGSACEIRHDLCLSPILLPAQHPCSLYFGSMVWVPFLWSQPISTGNSPTRQLLCLQQRFGLNSFCNRSCCLLRFLQPFAACLSWAPSLPGATHVHLTCSPLPEGLCCFYHFLYIFILGMFRCPPNRHQSPFAQVLHTNRGTRL